jgi:hypothetical protein
MLNVPRTVVRQGNFVFVQISEEKVEAVHRGWSERNSLAKLGDEYKTMPFWSFPESLKSYSERSIWPM